MDTFPQQGEVREEAIATMPVKDIFPRQDEAWEYVRSIANEKERLFTEIALAKALSFLVSDPEYQQISKNFPVDLLMYARLVHDLFRRDDILVDILGGKVMTIDDLSPFS